MSLGSLFIEKTMKKDESSEEEEEKDFPYKAYPCKKEKGHYDDDDDDEDDYEDEDEDNYDDEEEEEEEEIERKCKKLSAKFKVPRKLSKEKESLTDEENY